MYNANDALAGITKTNVAQATKLAALALENVDKLTKVNLLAAKSALAQGVEAAQAVAAVKDVQQLATLNTALADAGMKTAMAYWKNLYEIATEAQAKLAALVEESGAAYTKDAAVWVDQASKSAPAGSEAAVNAFRQGFAASTAAFDQFSQASKQVLSLADANIRTAAANASKVAAPTKGRKAA